MKQKTKESTESHAQRKQTNKKATENNFTVNKPEHISYKQVPDVRFLSP